MDKLTPAVVQRIATDPGVDALASSVRYRRVPDEPKDLSGPVIVVRSVHPGDKPGYSGIAVVFGYEVDIWGYDGDSYNMAPDCERLAQRVTEALKGSRLKPEGGGETGIVRSEGFADVPQPDPRTIRLRAVFGGDYWSKQNMDALTGE